MKPPCKDCITIAICRVRARSIRALLHTCQLADNYIDPPDGVLRPGKERPMYRRTRINKIRKLLGLKKVSKRKRF
jgi:hypothetical protein